MKTGLIFVLVELICHVAIAQLKPNLTTHTATPNALLVSLDQPSSIPIQSFIPEIVISSASSHRPGYLLAGVYGWNALQRRAEINAYLSTDNGVSWHHVLRDASTPWVSEISCAYGPDGNAYLVASASKRTGITRGHPYGQRHLFHSSDDGLTWEGPTNGPFVDWTALAVDTTKGANRGQIYLFGHDVAVSPGNWRGPAKPLLVSRDKGASFDSTTFTGKWPTSGGGYPLAARVLRDGQVVALYRRQNPGAYVVTLSQDGGKSNRELMAVPKDPLVQRIGALSAGFDVDQTQAHYNGRFYLAYPAVRTKQKVIMLARSEDGGSSWRNSVAIKVSTDTASISELGYVSLAINSEGTVGLNWFDPTAQASYFSYSVDGGDLFSNPVRLSINDNSQQKIPYSIQDYMQTMGTYEPDIADSSMGSALAVGKGLSIRLIDAGLGFVQMSCDPSGAFHPIWTEYQPDGKITLTTRNVIVGKSQPPISSKLSKQLIDVTKRVLIDVVSQQFDSVLNEYQLGFTITNTSDSTFQAPLRLRINRLTAGQNFQTPQVLNATNKLISKGDTLALDEQLINGVLTPGQSTRPYVIRFRSYPKQSYETIRRQMRAGQTPHPISVEFEILTGGLTPP